MRSASGQSGLDRRQFLHLASVATASGLISRSPEAIADAKVPWRADGAGMARVGLLVRITPARKFTEVAAEEVHDWIVANTPSQAEAVVVAGNGLRAVGAIDALEASLERPVITANQAMLWKGLRLAGAPAHLEQYGRLLKLESTGQQVVR